MSKFIRPFILFALGLLLSFGAFKIFKISGDYITFERKVESVEKNNQNIYFEFYDDYKDKETKVYNKYSFTAYEGVDVDYIVNNIKIGDTIRVTADIKNINGNFKYILIQKVEKDENVVFDSIEYYRNHNMNLRIIFVPTIIVIFLFLIIMCFVDFDKKNTLSNFLIKNPKWQFSLFIVAILFGSIVPLLFTILLSIGKLTLNTYQFSYVFYIFLILGILGLICFLRNGIKYDSNNYYIYQSFKKTKKINKADIEKVLIDMTGNKKNKSGVYCKNKQKIIGISFEFNYYLSKKYFIDSLKANDVKFVKLILDKNGKEIEKEIPIF